MTLKGNITYKESNILKNNLSWYKVQQNAGDQLEKKNAGDQHMNMSHSIGRDLVHLTFLSPLNPYTRYSSNKM